MFCPLGYSFHQAKASLPQTTHVRPRFRALSSSFLMAARRVPGRQSKMSERALRLYHSPRLIRFGFAFSYAIV